MADANDVTQVPARKTNYRFDVVYNFKGTEKVVAAFRKESDAQNFKAAITAALANNGAFEFVGLAVHGGHNTNERGAFTCRDVTTTTA
jgi:hypothetical protein